MKRSKLKALATLIMTIFTMVILTSCGGEDSKKTAEKGDKMADLKAHFGLADNEALVVINGETAETHAKQIDGKYFIPAKLAGNINSCLYFNETEEQAMLTNGSGITYFYPDVTHKVVNGENVEMGAKALTFADGQMFIDVELAGVDVKVEKDPARIVIWTNVAGKNFYTANEKTALRTTATDKGEVLCYLAKGDYLIVTTSESNDYIGVTSDTGISGYVRVDKISDAADAASSYAVTSAKANEAKLASQYGDSHISFGENLLCVWHNMEYAADGSLLRGELDGSEGVDVVIPTWYTVANVDGSISSNANADYVQTAHNMGLKVLGLVDDFAPDVKGIEFLSNTRARQNFTDMIIQSAIDNGLDGINVDFEYITVESSKHYIQLMRELYLAAKAHNLALTVCIYVPNWTNEYYNYNALAQVCDYVFVMTYDEHMSFENVGPVASIDFVRNGVDSSLAYVPANRLIMGIPLYTRLWLDDGLGNEKIQVLTYKTQMNTVEARGLTPEWKEEDGYNYVEYNADGSLAKMWIEDEKSLALKKQVATERNIAGVSCWCLGYQNASVWDVLK